MIRIVDLEFQSSKHELIPALHPNPQEQSKKEKKTKLVFFTTDPAVKLLTLGKGPSCRLHIVTASGPSQAILRNYSIQRAERGPPTTLERSSVPLESPKSHASSLPKLLKYP